MGNQPASPEKVEKKLENAAGVRTTPCCGSKADYRKPTGMGNKPGIPGKVEEKVRNPAALRTTPLQGMGNKPGIPGKVEEKVENPATLRTVPEYSEVKADLIKLAEYFLGSKWKSSHVEKVIASFLPPDTFSKTRTRDRGMNSISYNLTSYQPRS